MFYNQSIESVVKNLGSNLSTGLSLKEAKARQKKFGPNELPPSKTTPLLVKFFLQFKNLLVIILLAATAVSFILGETVDAFAIFAIVILNALIGFIQEIQAEKTLEALKETDILYTLVLRDKNIDKIPFNELVPGDIVILEEGAKIPADGRVAESFSLHIDESILTGESLPVSKNCLQLNKKADIPLADRVNMVYKDTRAVSGRGKFIVTGTGIDTEIGKIAQALGAHREEKTPLTLELEKVAKNLTLLIGFIGVFMFIINFLMKKPLVESLLLSISLAVAAIPEGLTAIVTVVLSLGVKRLADKKIHHQKTAGS